jgi:hypothetical protein
LLQAACDCRNRCEFLGVGAHAGAELARRHPLELAKRAIEGIDGVVADAERDGQDRQVAPLGIDEQRAGFIDAIPMQQRIEIAVLQGARESPGAAGTPE